MQQLAGCVAREMEGLAARYGQVVRFANGMRRPRATEEGGPTTVHTSVPYLCGSRWWLLALLLWASPSLRRG